MKLSKGKFRLAAFLLSVSAAGQSTSLKVYQAAVPGLERDSAITARFKANLDHPELGRAWVEVTVRTETFEGEMRVSERTYRVPVEGLKYDAVAKQVVFKPAGKGEAVCASHADLKSGKAGASGKCRLVSSLEKDHHDDGFTKKESLFGKVVLEVAD